MSGAQTAGAAETVTLDGASLLDQVVGATKQTAPDQAQDLVKNLVQQALDGTVTFDRNLTRTFDRAIAEIDRKLSTQLNAIIHSEKFLKLEGSWRGLNYLIMNSETGTQLKIRMFNASKRELNRDLTKAVEFDQSQLFKKIYENEFGTPGGEPYGTLIGDYEWTNHPDDVESLRLISNVAAAGFSPFISAAGAGMFGFDDWTELSKPRDLAKIFETAEYAKWRSFRESEDARFVNLVMPRVVARLPYGKCDQADRRVQLRGSAVRRLRCCQGAGPQGILLDERGLCDGRAYDRCVRAARFLRGHPRRRGRRQGGEFAEPRVQER